MDVYLIPVGLDRYELYCEDHADAETIVGDVPPTAYAIPRANELREDEPQPSITHEAAMANAPAQAEERFMVPKIAETGA